MSLPPGAMVWHAAGNDAAWSTESHLLASAVDSLRVANWMQSQEGSKGQNRPDPLPRPAQMAEEQAKQDRVLDRAKAWRQAHT